MENAYTYTIILILFFIFFFFYLLSYKIFAKERKRLSFRGFYSKLAVTFSMFKILSIGCSTLIRKEGQCVTRRVYVIIINSISMFIDVSC